MSIIKTNPLPSKPIQVRSPKSPVRPKKLINTRIPPPVIGKEKEQGHESKGADHTGIAVGEVGQVYNPNIHGETNGHQGVHAVQHQKAD